MNWILKLKHWQLFGVFCFMMIACTILVKICLSIYTDKHNPLYTFLFTLPIDLILMSQSALYISYSIAFLQNNKSSSHILYLSIIIPLAYILLYVTHKIIYVFLSVFPRDLSTIKNCILMIIFISNIILCPWILASTTENIHNPTAKINWPNRIRFYFYWLFVHIGVWGFQPILNDFVRNEMDTVNNYLEED